MKITILSIGNELLSGDTINTNAGWMGRILTEIGCDICQHITVPDKKIPIFNALNQLINLNPDFIILSSGFDAHEMDPIGGLKVTTQGYATMTEYFVRIAEECCKGRILSVLEGGYNLKALSESVAVHLRELSGMKN